jgi:hypothetical protein
MRYGCAALVVLIAGLARAADAPKPNTLTPEEIADGWISLFDGETTFGWLTGGPVAVKDGVLTLGGTTTATAQTSTAFGLCDLTVDAAFDGKAGEQFALQDFGTGQTRMSGKAPWPIVEKFHGTAPAMAPKPLTFVAPPGSRLEIRSVKVKPQGLAPIFNGKDLTGWKVFPGARYKSVYTVTPEGWINVKNGPGDLQTEREWADFVLQLECISNGKALNSGVFFRCLPNQYQQGYEMQIQNGYKDDDRTKPADFGTGAIYRRIPARKVVSNDHEWFTMTLVAHGNHIATWVNGYQTVDWTDTRPPHENPRNGSKTGPGHISLQGHDPTTDLSFRNLRIAELPDKK